MENFKRSNIYTSNFTSKKKQPKTEIISHVFKYFYMDNLSIQKYLNTCEIIFFILDESRIRLVMNEKNLLIGFINIILLIPDSYTLMYKNVITKKIL